MARAGKTAGPVLLSEGFRVFFFSAGVFGIAVMAIWIGWLAVHAAGGALTYTPFEQAPHLWHAHEMIYGYGGAVVAGFFLTAVPNWTGAPPSRTAYVSAVAALWLAGRLAMLFSAELPAALVMAVDVSFLPVLGVKIFLNLLKRPKPQNMMLLAVLSMLAAGNILMHLDWTGLAPGLAEGGARLGLLTLAAMISIIGGRVTPAFTRNALMRDGATGKLPVTHPLASAVGIASALLLALLTPLAPHAYMLAAVAAAAAIANGLRLIGWRVLSVLDQPILWSLHLGFAMLVAGYGLLAWHWAGGAIGETAALHMLGIGAVGGMTLAVMSRAALGHTGRDLVVARPVAAAYLMIAAAAFSRALGSLLFPDSYFTVMFVAGAFWLAAFALFLLVYAPILTLPRRDASL